MLAEKIFRRAKTFAKQSPQTLTADLAAVTIEPQHRPLRIFFSRLVDLRSDPQPIADRCNLSERNPGLRHAERAGIHPEENDALCGVAIEPQIHFVRAPGVIERV